MILSMTGFGIGSRDTDSGGTITVELRSVNGRFLKVNWRLPAALSQHEVALDKRLRERLRRGSVSATITVQYLPASAGGIVVNEAAVRAYQREFARLGLSAQTIPMLPGVTDASAAQQGNTDDGNLFKALMQAFEDALEQLLTMRAQEGEALKKALLTIVERIEGIRKSAANRAPAVVEEYRDRLRARLAALLADVAEAAGAVDPALLAREVAVFAERSDITEELDRMASHLVQVRDHVGRGGEVGKTLDFLTQEMHREVNTMGSKSADGELSQHVVALKADIERFREQAANVE